MERAGCLQGMGEAGEFAAIGPFDDQRHRQAGERRRAIVAQQRHQLNRLARAVDAALGVEKGIDRPRLGTAIDAAVGKVKCRFRQFEACEFLPGGVGGHDGEGFRRPLALDQAGGEGCAAVGRRQRLGNRLVAARQQNDFQAGQRLGAL